MKIILKVLGQEWSQTGESIKEALSNFDLDWVEIKGKGTITIIDGEKKHEHLYNMAELRRIFNNKIMLGVAAKNLELLLK